MSVCHCNVRVQGGGRLSDELNYLDGVKAANNRRILEEKHKLDRRIGRSVRNESITVADTVDVPVDKNIGGGLSGGFTLFIQTAMKDGDTLLTQEEMLLHADILTNIANIRIPLLG